RARLERVAGPPALTVRDLVVADDRGLEAVRGVSFDVGAGEIVGIAGVEGNGQHELVEAIAGLRVRKQGDLAVRDRRLSGPSPREHTLAGLAHVPGDRLHRGMVGEMSLAENLVLGRQRDRDVGRGPWLTRRALDAHARPLLDDFDVRPPTPSMQARQLSGG